MLNKDDSKWFSKIINRLTSFNLKLINSRMGFKQKQRLSLLLPDPRYYPDQQSYIESKTKAYKGENVNSKTINDIQHFSAALLKRTSEIFKPLTTIRNKSLKQKT